MSNTRSRAARRVGVGLITVGALVGGLAAPTPVSAEGRPPKPPTVQVIQEGLSSPKGLTAYPGPAPIIAQGAFGPPGPVLLSIRPGETLPLTDASSLVDVVLGADHSLWGLESGTGQLYRSTHYPTWTHVADIPAYQATDPDLDDNEGNPTESNPYGLAALPDGAVLVADAAGNDVLRVGTDGSIHTVARFQRELIATDHIPDFEGPPALPAESVPTSIAVTKHAIYVGELKGFPFRPGSSNVYKLALDAKDVTCSPAAPTKACRIVHDDLTAIQDLAVDPKTGTTYVYELAAGGTLAFEEGFETGVFPPAVLLEIRGKGARRELAAGQLSQPGGVIVERGTVHVTDGVFGAGRLVKVRTS